MLTTSAGVSYREVNFNLFSGEDLEVGAAVDGPDTAPTAGRPSLTPPISDSFAKKVLEGPEAGDQKLGTLMGVFVPCLQNILGVILFIRLSWIVGQAGVGQGLAVVGMCCACTFMTSLSLSALATNGEIQGGGPYFLIGHSLGPQVGVSVGLCFYLGTSVAAAMYILGAVETILHSIKGMRIYTPRDAFAPSVEDYQIYGTIITVLVGLIVASGMQRLSKIAPLFLAPVLVSVVCIWLGIWTSSEDSSGVTGFKGTTLGDNMGSVYFNTNQHGLPSVNGGFSWSFAGMVALFFPSVTGIMAGSNRSACLKDAQDSIPKGTLGAQLTTTTIYMLSVVFFGGVATRDLLLRERLLAASISWPVAEVVYLGITLSTLGAALQSMSGAPRLLQAIANDRILPFLNFLACPEEEDPTRCLIVTICITIGCCLGGNLDVITPIITMFFLICYLGVNGSCALLANLNLPSWRPRFRFYHWGLSLLGAVFCLVIMFLISWLFTVVAFGVAAVIYYYVSTQATADWGDGLKSVRIRVAISSLLSLGGDAIHAKNWYPAPLVIAKPWGLLEEDTLCHPMLIQVATYFQPNKKAAAAMSMVAGVVTGTYQAKAVATDQYWEDLRAHVESVGFHGFTEVLCSNNFIAGFNTLLQIGGLGNLRPNIVIMRYPEEWNTRTIPPQLTTMVRATHISGKAMCILRNLDTYADINEVLSGTIDLYWLTQDGGLMLLLGEMLKKHAHFRRCKVRVFIVASSSQGTLTDIEASVKSYLYQLRMKNVELIVIDSEEIINDPDMRQDVDRRMEGAKELMEQFKYAGASPETASETGSAVGSDISERHQNFEETLYDEKLYPNDKLERFYLQNITLNCAIRKQSKNADLVLCTLPPPPGRGHPAHLYMHYLDLLLEGVPRSMLVRGYRRNVMTIYQ